MIGREILAVVRPPISDKAAENQRKPAEKKYFMKNMNFPFNFIGCCKQL
jgi:hypothetical protein